MNTISLDTTRDLTIILSLLIISFATLKAYLLYAKHLHSKRSYDLATNTLEQLFYLHDAITLIRHPKEKVHDDNFVSKSSAVFEAQKLEYQTLTEHLHKKRYPLEINLLEIEKRFGKKSSALFTPLFEAINTLEKSITHHLQALDPYDTSLARSSSHKAEDEAVLYAPTLGEDQFDDKITASIETIKQHLTQYLL